MLVVSGVDVVLLACVCSGVPTGVILLVVDSPSV